MRRVLHVRQSSRYLGLERLVLQAAAPLRRQGYETAITILYTNRGLPPDVSRSLPPLHPMIEAAKPYRVEVEQILDRSKWPGDIVRRIGQKIRAGQFDLLHPHGTKEDLVAFLVARRTGVPVVATAHGFSRTFRRLRLYRLLDLLLLRTFPAVIAVSEAMRGELVAAGVRPERVRVVHDAIDSDDFRAQAGTEPSALRRQLGIEEGAVVLVAARLSPEKGHAHFLAAAREVLGRRPDTHFVILGEGPLRAELEAMTASLSLNGAVHFLGFRTDVADFMNLSDIVALPSIREPFGDVLLEAAALAKPVVATNVDGIREIVRHGETGLLVPPADVRALAGAMLRLIANPAQAQAMGTQARGWVAREFSMERMAQRTAAVYDEVLGETRSNSGMQNAER
ncbi:MAG: glycosyltransferase family 4 protein [Chloroflexi bacterium]|nr:glycosyltransferase family 4 protein [Chloroflexota bacterium]